MKMGKFIETQTRKMVGAFAGVGALVEDDKGVVKIEPIDKWRFFTSGEHQDEQHHIADKRLLDRLKNDKGFPKLRSLVKVPTTTTWKPPNARYAWLTDQKMVAAARYFPEWMFCSKCNRFQSLQDWWQKWDKAIAQNAPDNVNWAKEFIPPKCGFCYEEGWQRYQELTQVRFIMTSSDGEVRDVPWNEWITIKQQAKIEEDATLDLSRWNPCCGESDLRYQQGDFEDLTGITVSCNKCKKRSTLAGLFNLRFTSRGDKNHKYKVVLRSSNSVYYPILVHSLYLPGNSSISDAGQAKIDRWMGKNKDVDFMYDALDELYEKEDIQSYIDGKKGNIEQKEVGYRRREYQFILEKKVYRKDDFIFTHQETNGLYNGITHLVKVSRLKMTIVQTGYTRQEPMDVDLFLSGNIDKIKPKYTSTQAKNTEYLLGVENLGEGIFISLDKNVVAGYNKQEIGGLLERSRNSPLFKNHFKNEEHLAKFVWVHTLSHILMKELEFSCGYSVASLSERLFVDEGDMQGVLIYTVGGMEGSYGGLASQAGTAKFKQLLENALERAKDCASDPVCYHSEGQGVGELNLAACYSCALVAENACEVFNSFLDRKALDAMS